MYGSMPIDDGHLILSREDVEAFLKESPDNIRFIRKYAGGDEIINNKERWCLWLEGQSKRDASVASHYGACASDNGIPAGQ